MMIDISKEEVEALNTWNCAMLIKRKNRALLCKSFYYWKQNLNTFFNSKAQDSSFTQKNQQRTKNQFNSKKTQEYSNQALQEELDSLIEEQKQLEEATARIKETLKGMPRAPQSQYRSQFSSFSGRFSQSGRLDYK